MIDETGRTPGRGAYLCRDAACFDLAARRRALGRALGTSIPVDVEDILAAGPTGAAATTNQTPRAPGSRSDTSHDTITGGEAHGQE
jgi:predicted RNA-binding protein YlxR (DUF448 family)